MSKIEETPKPKKKYRGYINYKKFEPLTKRFGTVKSHQFNDLTKKEVERLVEQFKNPTMYEFIGYIANHIKPSDKADKKSRK